MQCDVLVINGCNSCIYLKFVSAQYLMHVMSIGS